MPELVVVGLSHRTAPVELRERLAVPSDRLAAEIATVRSNGAVAEAVLLSTCNRVEVYAVAEHVSEAVSVARRYLSTRAASLELDEALYYRHGEEAARHAFRVAASLDSMVVGEPQILGQLKDAFDVAKDAGAVGTLLGRCFTHAFSVAKRIRVETGIAAGTVSVSSIATDLARKIFGDLAGRHVLLIGAGEMAESAARNLVQAGARLHVVNRSLERGEALAREVGGEAKSFDRLSSELVAADVVISSTGSERFILTVDLMRQVVRSRRRRPIFLIDIAVPRDVDPRVGELENAFVYDVDDLQQVAEENLALRRREADLAERIVDDEVRAFQSWRRSLVMTPTIVALRERVVAAAKSELEKTLPRLGALDDSQRQALEKMTQALVNKVLHQPLTELRKSAEAGDPEDLLSAVRRLFALEDVPAEAAAVPDESPATEAASSASVGSTEPVRASASPRRGEPG